MICQIPIFLGRSIGGINSNFRIPVYDQVNFVCSVTSFIAWCNVSSAVYCLMSDIYRVSLWCRQVCDMPKLPIPQHRTKEHVIVSSAIAVAPRLIPPLYPEAANAKPSK
jgi:hypothetical protein